MGANKRGPEPGSEKARHGGQAVREKYGPEFYSRIGKKGGEAVKNKLGSGFYAEIGKKGGESTKRQQGPEFYSRIGKKGGERGRGTPKQSTSATQGTRDRASLIELPWQVDNAKGDVSLCRDSWRALSLHFPCVSRRPPSHTRFQRALLVSGVYAAVLRPGH